MVSRRGLFLGKPGREMRLETRLLRREIAEMALETHLLRLETARMRLEIHLLRLEIHLLRQGIAEMRLEIRLLRQEIAEMRLEIRLLRQKTGIQPQKPLIYENPGGKIRGNRSLACLSIPPKMPGRGKAGRHGPWRRSAGASAGTAHGSLLHGLWNQRRFCRVSVGVPLRAPPSTPPSMKRLLAFLILASCAAAAQPNVILMMGDDHGWEETGYHGHPHVKTPLLDEMAATGLRLDAFYAGHPSCSPTRASFLTGRHPNRMGTFAPGWSFRPEEITSARILSEAGYRCGHFGKWHLGAVKAESPVCPGAMGFHEWVSHDNFFELNPSLSRNGGAPEIIKGEGSEVVVREAIEFIDRALQAGKPFFTVVWFGSPHEPYSGLPEDLALYDELPAKYKTKMVKLTSNETGAQTRRPQGEVLRERYAEITAMDRAIGVLRKHLAAQGLRENTLLFYCGDNGTSPDASLVTPHRGVKGAVYDGGLLVPGLIEWPARIPKPRTSTVRATTSDLLPTLCAITGQPLPQRPIDGVDLTALIDGTMTLRPKPLFFWDCGIGKAQGEPYIDPKLQEGTTPLAKMAGGKATRDFSNKRHPTISDEDTLGPRAIIDGDLKLVIRESKQGAAVEELFDLAADPEEKTNLLKQRADAAEKLRVQMRAWQGSVLRSLTGADYGR